ncbi:MAG: hypothetical protein J6B01_04860 [Ruminococcus sp.]|nr:hypothetical protein [Ruminococcus sp.]MBO5319123.1 hypothetical protein [Ruminococcus sp.]
MWEVKIIKSGKELLDSGITKFEVLNGAWVGEVDIRNSKPCLYCYRLDGTFFNVWQLHNNTPLILKIKPLSYESLSEKCRKKRVSKLKRYYASGMSLIEGKWQSCGWTIEAESFVEAAKIAEADKNFRIHSLTDSVVY